MATIEVIEIDRKTLRSIRKGEKKTQAQIAEDAHMSTNAYQMIESGETADPKIKTLGRIADALGVRINQLYTEDPMSRIKLTTSERLMERFIVISLGMVVDRPRDFLTDPETLRTAIDLFDSHIERGELRGGWTGEKEVKIFAAMKEFAQKYGTPLDPAIQAGVAEFFVELSAEELSNN